MPLLRVRLLVLALLLVVCTAVPSVQAADPPAFVRPDDFQERVDRAIDLGVEWLLAQQEDDGSYEEMAQAMAGTAICYYTLRVCGVPRTDPEMERAYVRLRAEYEEARDAGEIQTYAAALVMMAIEEHGQERNRPGANSRYGRFHDDEIELEKPDLEWMRELVEWMEGNQGDHGGWRYGEPLVGRTGRRRAKQLPPHGDLSNSQYALLGLKSASRCGVEVEKKTWLRSAEYFLRGQEPEGPRIERYQPLKPGETAARVWDRARGFGYYSPFHLSRGHAYGSMTVGGISSLAILQSELDGKRGVPRAVDRDLERGIHDGAAWMGEHFDVTRNPKHDGWHYYYLYGLERAGRIAGIDWMGRHDWYGEGALFLVEAQLTGREPGRGYWRDAGSDVLNTCFALLFLRKGTKAVRRRGPVTASEDELGINFDVVDGLSEEDFDDFVDTVLGRWARTSSKALHARIGRECARVGTKMLGPLLRRLDVSREDRRVAAHELLVAMTGATIEYDGAAERRDRADGLAAWEFWYLKNGSRLRFDASTGRLLAR